MGEIFLLILIWAFGIGLLYWVVKDYLKWERERKEQQRQWDEESNRRNDAFLDAFIVAYEHQQMNEDMLLEDEPRYWPERCLLAEISLEDIIGLKREVRQ